MNIDELAALRRQLETELTDIVEGKLTEFYRKSGVTPRSIWVDMVEVTGFGEARPRHSVAGVCVDINL